MPDAVTASWTRTVSILAAGLIAASPAVAATYTPTETANIRAVVGFYDALDQAEIDQKVPERIGAIAERYLSPAYVQHSALFLHLPGTGTARDKLVRMFRSMPPRPAGAPPPTFATLSVSADGDRVMLFTSRDDRDPANGRVVTAYIFNMFRVADGKLAEHWSVSSGAPPATAQPAPGNQGR